MQIILTEEEHFKLVESAKRGQELPTKEQLQKLCTEIANKMPVDWGWTEGDPEKPWGCMLTHQGEWYCDSCPVQDICPHEEKEWSK